MIAGSTKCWSRAFRLPFQAVCDAALAAHFTGNSRLSSSGPAAAKIGGSPRPVGQNCQTPDQKKPLTGTLVTQNTTRKKTGYSRHGLRKQLLYKLQDTQLTTQTNTHTPQAATTKPLTINNLLIIQPTQTQTLHLLNRTKPNQLVTLKTTGTLDL